MPKKFAMLIIGDEILCGKTKDANLQVLALKLGEKGYALAEVRVVMDDFDEIIFAVNELRKKYFLVFTSGGIGPTHDDITSHAIAKAFNLEFEINEEAREILSQYYLSLNLEFTEARMRMTKMPRGAKLIENKVSKAPGFQIENVCVLAGIPKIFVSMLESFVETLEEGVKMFSLTLESENVTEGMIALEMEKVQKKYAGSVFIGSYPKLKEDGKFMLQITFRGPSLKKCEDAKLELETILKSVNHSNLSLENKI